MKCPYCGHPHSRVKDSREVGDSIHRRRECEQCHRRFSTYERVEMDYIMVVKRDGRRERFDRQKILLGIRKASEKRPLPVGELERVVEEIEESIYALGKLEVPSSIIGEMVMEKLRGLDQIAYIRFASVYRAFTDIEAMRQELEQLIKDAAQRPSA
jgi:transcriptional repressor NrdR